MGYFQVRYDSSVVNYDRRGFIRLATVLQVWTQLLHSIQILTFLIFWSNTIQLYCVLSRSGSLLEVK